MSDEDLSGLLAFYTLTQENWDALEEDTRIVLRSLYTERAKVYKDLDPSTMAGGEKPDADPVLEGGGDEEEECDDCDEEISDDAEEDTPPDEETPKDDDPKIVIVPFQPTKSVEELLRRQR